MTLIEIFAPGGLLTRRLPHFRARESQLAMAQAIEDAVETRSSLVAEAGTGTGKTFAYLVPALLAGGRLIVSTATKTLQDQLVKRDLPTICGALGLTKSTALLKGRDNYLCRHRLDSIRQGRLMIGERRQFETIEQWSRTTRSGDKAELSTLSDQSPLWSQVTSTAESCLGGDCPNFDGCFVMQARRDAFCADIVVVNHHLFLADRALKNEEVGELLPAADIFVFDEAHQLPEIASAFFGESISTTQLTLLNQDIASLLTDLAVDFDVASSRLRHFDAAIARIKTSLPTGFLKLSAAQAMDYPSLGPAISALLEAMLPLSDLLLAVDDGSATTAALIDRLACAEQTIDRWGRRDDDDAIDWIETSNRTIRFNRTPLSVAPKLAPTWTELVASKIFLSATLAIDRDFSHFVDAIGLDAPKTAQWDSPFDYSGQTLLYLPLAMPDPNAVGFTEAVVSEAMTLMTRCPGGAFFLLTSLAAVKTAQELVANAIESSGLDIELLVQGEAPRTELLSGFRAADRAILIGSYSFWEGVDMAGPRLSLVVIDKIPFSPPNDPILDAKTRRLRTLGKNPFLTLQLAPAIISLKQGTGRLIRSESDRGVLMIGDGRLFSKSYGSKILRSLPFPSLTRDRQTALDFFDRIRTTTGTPRTDLDNDSMR